MRTREKQLAKEIKMRPGGMDACRGACCLCLRRSKLCALDFDDNFFADGEILREEAGCAARGDANGKKVSVQERGKVVIKTSAVGDKVAPLFGRGTAAGNKDLFGRAGGAAGMVSARAGGHRQAGLWGAGAARRSRVAVVGMRPRVRLSV